MITNMYMGTKIGTKMGLNKAEMAPKKSKFSQQGQSSSKLQTVSKNKIGNKQTKYL